VGYQSNIKIAVAIKIINQPVTIRTIFKYLRLW
jgi:hypothetical protein